MQGFKLILQRVANPRPAMLGGVWKKGSLRLFRLGRIPVWAHFSVPLVMLWVGGARFAPGAWLGILLVIFCHECGHAYLARLHGLRVFSIEMTGLGGVCRFEQPSSGRVEQIIAWGGVLAQLGLLIPALLLPAIGLWPSGPFFSDLGRALIFPNFLMIVLNLLPVPPLDGDLAWKLFRKPKWLERKSKPRGASSRQPQRAGSPSSSTTRERDQEAVNRSLDEAVKRAIKER